MLRRRLEERANLYSPNAARGRTRRGASLAFRVERRGTRRPLAHAHSHSRTASGGKGNNRLLIMSFPAVIGFRSTGGERERGCSNDKLELFGEFGWINRENFIPHRIHLAGAIAS